VVGTGEWRWVRLDPASLSGVDLARVKLRGGRRDPCPPGRALAVCGAARPERRDRGRLNGIDEVTESATYHERVLEAPIRTREGIRAYWQSKVVESQANIERDLLSLYLDGDTAIAEWEARFDDLPQGVRKRMREVAILVFEGKQIASLREYWSGERIGHLPAPRS
jgi:SnoaL-like domain